MGDEQQTQAKLLLYFAQQLQNLRLHRHIQGTHRFIGHQDLRPAGQGTGDGDALALSAAELARIAGHGLRGQLHLLQELFGQGFGLTRTHAKVTSAFHQRLTHRHAWIERSVGVLKHHLHTVAQGSQTGFGQSGNLIFAPKNLAAARVNQAQHTPRQRGFT